MTKYVTEMLQEINDDPTKLEKYKSNQALHILLNFAFHPNGKFLLPEGEPPFKPDAAPIGMSPANLLMEIKRFYVFVRKDIKSVRREQLFIQLLESVHPSEAKLLIAIKDQKLSKLYKNITHKLVYDAGIVKAPPPAPPAKKTVKNVSTSEAS